MTYVSLMPGDCLDVLPLIASGSIDAIIADPPYGTTACKWDAVIPFAPMWGQLKRVIKPNGAIVMTASQPFTSALIMSNVKDFKYCWVWEKNKASGHLNAKKMPLKIHEDVVVFYGKPPTYNPQMTDGHKPMNYAERTTHTEVYGAQRSTISDVGTTLRYPKSIQPFAVVNNDDPGRLHPNQKPVALMEYLIRTYTNLGDTVLDFTMGSGTTGVACKRLGRNFIGIEKDPEYFKIAQERIDKGESNA